MSTPTRMYIPASGQADGPARASALNAGLSKWTMSQAPRYASRISSLPCVVLEYGETIVVVNEPTTLAVVDAAAVPLQAMADAPPPPMATIVEADVPVTIARVTQVDTSVATHAAAVNPHNITAAGIGAASSSHAHVDTDLPAGLARDAEVAAVYAPIHTHPYAGSAHNHVDADIPATIARDAEVAAAYAVIAHNHDAAYSLLAHTHAVPSAGVIRKTANQTMTLTAQTAVTDMSFPVAAGATYYFVMSLRVTTSTGTSPTSAWGFTGPASPTAVAINAEQDTSTSVEVKGLLTAFGNLAAGAQVANTGAEFRGVIQNGPNAGTVQLTVARGGTTPSMVIPLGCNGMWLRVA